VGSTVGKGNDTEPADPKATVWLKPEQVSAMRDGTVANSAGYLAGRNDAILALLYDTGLHVGELVALDVEMLDLNEGVLMLPASIQKDYPNDNTPQYTEIELASEVVRTLRMYSQLALEGQPHTVPLAPSRAHDYGIGTERRPIVRRGRRRSSAYYRGTEGLLSR